MRDRPRVLVDTPADVDRHGGIGNGDIDGWDPRKLADTLFRDYRIFAVGINRAGVIGLRITPNLYTTLEELDALVSAIKEASAPHPAALLEVNGRFCAAAERSTSGKVGRAPQEVCSCCSTR